MEEGGLRGDVKDAVGATLAGPPGVLCLRTACQDIVPRCLSGPCKDAARGREARRLCRPRLRECQDDPDAIARCAARCARYYSGPDLATCERDCNRVRCAVYPRYEDCVRVNTLANVLACFERSCRADAARCLAARCQLDAADVSLVKASLPGSVPSPAASSSESRE